MTFTTSVTATTEIGRLTIGTMIRQKICVSRGAVDARRLEHLGRDALDRRRQDDGGEPDRAPDADGDERPVDRAGVAEQRERA